MKWKPFLICALICCMLCGCATPKKTIALIDAIGTVSLESEAQIVEAEEAYNALSDKNKEEVKNYDVLVSARAEYDLLKAVDDYLTFYRDHPYTYQAEDYAADPLVDAELIAAYEQALSAAQQAGVTVEMCPELEYAELVISLGEYEKYEQFVHAVLNNKEIYHEAMSVFSGAVLDALLWDKIDEAIEGFDECSQLTRGALKNLEAYDPNAENMEEVIGMFQELAEQAEYYKQKLSDASYSSMYNLFQDSSKIQENLGMYYFAMDFNAQYAGTAIGRILEQLAEFSR